MTMKIEKRKMLINWGQIGFFGRCWKPIKTIPVGMPGGVIFEVWAQRSPDDGLPRFRWCVRPPGGKSIEPKTTIFRSMDDCLADMDSWMTRQHSPTQQQRHELT